MEWKARAFRGIHSSGAHLLFLTLFLDDLTHKSISVLKNKHMQQMIIYQIMSGFKVQGRIEEQHIMRHPQALLYCGSAGEACLLFSCRIFP